MKNNPFLFLLMLLALSFPVTAQSSPESRFTSFDGTRIHYEVVGEGKPVVLIHGFIVNSGTWKKAAVRQALVDAGFKVVTLDLRGNGGSDKPHEAEAYRNDAEARDVMGLMRHLGLTNYAVVGYSRGSIITARLLVLDQQVRAAVLGGMGADFTNPNWPRRIAFYEALDGQAHRHPELQGAVTYARTSGADTVALRRMQQMQPSTSKEELGRVKVPVLVISGDQDADNGAADLARMLPGSTLKTVPGNHNNTAGSEGFAREVVAFLK